MAMMGLDVPPKPEGEELEFDGQCNFCAQPVVIDYNSSLEFGRFGEDIILVPCAKAMFHGPNEVCRVLCPRCAGPDLYLDGSPNELLESIKLPARGSCLSSSDPWRQVREL